MLMLLLFSSFRLPRTSRHHVIIRISRPFLFNGQPHEGKELAGNAEAWLNACLLHDYGFPAESV
ncbi:hypothetical protein CXU19_05205 [Akkermansia muciniphila]|nr:hypothetical protein CXU19_05205 [Akkermansia muciniphila]PNC40980.1 hypothetical protein CXU20_06690 [Akkermansia muciniphila]